MDCVVLVLVELFLLKALLRLSLDLDCHSHSDLLRHCRNIRVEYVRVFKPFSVWVKMFGHVDVINRKFRFEQPQSHSVYALSRVCAYFADDVVAIG